MICTQGKVIPIWITWWCERDGVPGPRNRKGSTRVLSCHRPAFVTADHRWCALAANVRA